MNVGRLALLVAVLSVLTIATLFAAGNKEAPQVEVQASAPQYLSPNGDGVKDTADLAFTVKLRIKSKDGYVPSYSVTISDSSGNVVKKITETQKSDLNWFVKLFTGYKEFTLTKTITWDGKNDSGQVVPDGTYHTKLTVADANGNTKDIALSDFIVDTVAPTASVSPGGGMVFSPNGDGNLDTFPINQENGSAEALWTGTFADASGTVVRTYSWKNEAPPSFAWDGKDDSGKVVPDGTYTYTLSSTDQAGNASKKYQITGIELNTQATQVTLSLTNPYFSPNGDGVEDTTAAELATTAKIPVVSWSLELANAGGNIVRQTNGEGEFPQKVPFDGTDSSGNKLPDGSYTVTFKATFQNGNQQSASAPLVLNTQPPKLALSFDNPYFSPNGDGSKDTTTATLAVTAPAPVESWSIALLSPAGKSVRSGSGSGAPPASLVFDGKDASGAMLPEGSYTAKLSVTTKDGMSAGASEPLVIDVTPPVVVVQASTLVFTPTAPDPKQNTETISISSNEPVTWTGSLENNAGQTLMTTAQPLALQKVVLDKSVPQVAEAPEGMYRLSLTFTDRAGNRASAKPLDIALLAHPIETTVTTAGAFSPNGDGTMDSLPVQLSTSQPDGIKSWDVAAVSSSGTAVADYSGNGPLPSQFAWDGKTGQMAANTAVAPDGTYTARLTVNYANGIVLTASSSPFNLDTTPPEITVSGTPNAFIVNGTQLDGSITGKVTVADADPVTEWTAVVVSPDGKAVKSMAGKGNPTQSFTLNGSLPIPGAAPKELAAYGFAARLTATDSVGNTRTVTVQVPIEVIGKKRSDGKIQLLVPDVLFGAYQYALDSRSQDQYRLNLQTLQSVVALMNRYPSEKLEVDGYSMEIYSPGTAAYTREESIIIPLSKNRADTVRNALIDRGLSGDRVVAQFFGGKNPLVDPNNVNLREVNRRVEFILLPPSGSGM